MKVTSAAKVGFTVIVTALVLVSIYKGLGWNIPGLHWGKARGYPITVSFASVKGLASGADVQLNGNAIGEVERIDNTVFGQVRVTLRIKSDIPIHEHATFVISRESIFGSYIVSIEEPLSGVMTDEEISNGEFSTIFPSGAVHEGALVVRDGEAIGQVVSVRQNPDDPNSIIARVRLAVDVPVTPDMAFVPQPSGEITIYDKLAPEVIVEGKREPGPEDLVGEAAKALNDITAQVTVIMGQISQLLENFQTLLGPEDMRNLLDQLSAQTTLISGNIVTLTGNLNSIVEETQPHVTGTMENIEGLTADARNLISGLNEYNNPELRQNINELIANLNSASQQLDSILVDVQEYTSDEQLREDITGTFHEARARLQEAQGTLESVSTAIEEATTAIGAGVSGFQAEGEFTFRYAPEPDHFAGDLNFLLGWEGSEAFVVAGIDDIGENDRANAQIGWWVNENTAARVGVNRGKLGIGIDWRSEAFSIIGDLYDPNDLTWDIYAGYAIMPELDLIVGVEDAFNEDNMNFGLSYRF